MDGQPARVAYVDVRGWRSMLRNWWQDRSIYRAYMVREPDGAFTVTYWKPFWPRRMIRGAVASKHGDHYLSPRELHANLKGGDALKLWLHEAYWHGVKGEDGHTAKGIGAAGMITRNRTTSKTEAKTARRILEASTDVVVVSQMED